MFIFNKQSGQASRMLLVLAIVVLVAVLITFLFMKMVEKPKQPDGPAVSQPVDLPVYEKTLGDIRFIFVSAIDRGNFLKAADAVDVNYVSSNSKGLQISNPGAKFVQVTIGAQNVGKVNTEQNAWSIGNIIDSEGRNFIPLEGYSVQPWLPKQNLCGGVLKPAFDPSPCTKIYEVSKESTGFKIEVITGKNNSANNLSSKKTEVFLLDLIVK